MGTLSDQQLAAFLKSVPRVIPESEVVRIEQARTARQGYYVNAHMSVHHYEESRH